MDRVYRYTHSHMIYDAPRSRDNDYMNSYANIYRYTAEMERVSERR